MNKYMNEGTEWMDKIDWMKWTNGWYGCDWMNGWNGVTDWMNFNEWMDRRTE